jgi:aspartyl-tRNA(Asn)/glutamyl-tRNA(Gln) amidotransferase subunit C
MAVTIEDVRWVATLARLEFSPDEEERLGRELNRILEYMKKLDELDTEGVEPTAHVVPVAGVLRPDEAEVFGGVEELLALAPQTDQGYYRVPRIID